MQVQIKYFLDAWATLAHKAQRHLEGGVLLWCIKGHHRLRYLYRCGSGVLSAYAKKYTAMPMNHSP